MKTTTLIAVVCLSVPAFAQTPKQDFERAVVIEEQEHDLKQAAKLYESIATSQATPAELRTRAYLRLGKVLGRLGKKAEARNALEHAAKGSTADAEAAKALLQEGTQSKRVQQLRAKARAILEGDPNNWYEQLRWIGVDAVPEIIKYFEAGWRVKPVARPSPTLPQTGRLLNLLPLIWELGGDDAKRYIASVVNDKDKVRRTALAWGIPSNIHPELVDYAVQLMLDPEVEPQTRIQVFASIIHRLPLAAIVDLLRSKQVARQAWTILLQRWRSAPFVTHLEPAGKVIAPVVREAMNGDDALVSEHAREFLRDFALMTTATTKLLLDQVPTWPNVRPTESSKPQRASTANIGDLVRAARRLGRRRPDDQRGRWLSEVIKFSVPSWDRTELEPAVELIGLGYFESGYWNNSDVPYFVWLEQNGKKQDGRVVMRAVQSAPHPLGLIRWIDEKRVELTPADWPLFMGVFDRLSPSTIAGDMSVRYLFECLGRTGSPEAAGFFEKVAARSAFVHSFAAKGLIELSAIRNDEATLDAMRKLLRTELDERGTDAGQRTRRLLFSRLMELGDVETARACPELRAKKLTGPYLGDLEKLPVASQIEVWSYLLDQDKSYWAAAASQFDYRTSTLIVGPAHLVPLFASRLERALAASGGEPLNQEHDSLLARVLRIPGRMRELTPAGADAIARLVGACLKHASPRVRLRAVNALMNRGPRPENRNAVVALLDDPDGDVSKKAFDVVRSHVALDAAELRKVLTGHNNRNSYTVASLLWRWKGKDIELVTSLLSDPSSDVRISACAYLARSVDPRAVPKLLEALKDRDTKVRKAAADALRAIRFYHEQRAHWDRAFAGPQVTANDAAEALVKQADPKQPKEVRLLAIRSLGLLGKVETLPFLINYTQEKDADIAAAAKAAITAVQKAAAHDR